MRGRAGVAELVGASGDTVDLLVEAVVPAEETSVSEERMGANAHSPGLVTCRSAGGARHPAAGAVDRGELVADPSVAGGFAALALAVALVVHVAAVLVVAAAGVVVDLDEASGIAAGDRAAVALRRGEGQKGKNNEETRHLQGSK